MIEGGRLARLAGLGVDLRPGLRRVRDRLVAPLAQDLQAEAARRAAVDAGQDAAIARLRLDLAAATAGLDAAHATTAGLARALAEAGHRTAALDEAQVRLIEVAGGLARQVTALEAAQADGLARAGTQEAATREVAAARAADREVMEMLVATSLAALLPPPPPPPPHAGTPLVSVVMPVRDRAVQVGQAIRSLQRQTLAAWELIVVDDGSTDDTPARVEACLGDLRIRLIRSDHAGPSAARNRALAAVRAEIVAYLDSDNMAFPGYLEAVVGAFGAAPGLGCAYAALVSDAPHASGRILWQAWDRAALLRANYIDINVFSHRRGLLAGTGGFDETLSRLGDWDFILRCTADAAPRRLPTAGAHYATGGADRVTRAAPFADNRFRIQRKWRVASAVRPRVLYALWHYPQLSETYVEAELQAMRRLGAEIEVWSQEDVAAPYPPSVPFHRGSLMDAIVAFRPDVVHVHWLNMAPAFAAVAARTGVPVTVRAHGFDCTPDSIAEALASPGVARLDLFAHQAVGLADPRVHVTQPAFDTTLFRPTAGKDRRLVVRTAAALPAKDLTLFLEAACRLPTHRFVLAVVTCLRAEHVPGELRAEIARLGAPVELLVDLPREEAASLVGRAGVYLHTAVPPGLPGHTPIGMPISVAEAMATGAVVLVRDVPSLAEYVGDAGETYRDLDDAVARIAATMAWDDGMWAARAIRAVDRAYDLYADETVLAPLFDTWCALVRA